MVEVFIQFKFKCRDCTSLFLVVVIATIAACHNTRVRSGSTVLSVEFMTIVWSQLDLPLICLKSLPVFPALILGQLKGGLKCAKCVLAALLYFF